MMQDQYQHYSHLSRKRAQGRIRDLFSQVEITSNDLIMPYFVYEGLKESTDLTGLFGQKKHHLNSLLRELEELRELGISKALLFLIPKKKYDFEAEEKCDFHFEAQVIEQIKQHVGNDFCLMADLCLCSHSQTGHCGVFGKNEKIDHPKSVKILAERALVMAQAGIDCVAPSDMMDDRIMAIRNQLDQSGCSETLIMSYSSKFYSQFYGPFREAAESAPKQGDRKTYQIDPRNLADALLCSKRDFLQGADILMVKPAIHYLDVITKLKMIPELAQTKIAAYHVSGEYQGLRLLAEKGFLNWQAGLQEAFWSMKRAGADLIISYGAKELMKQVRS
jgi:porphobilinogen synthase